MADQHAEHLPNRNDIHPSALSSGPGGVGCCLAVPVVGGVGRCECHGTAKGLRKCNGKAMHNRNSRSGWRTRKAAVRAALQGLRQGQRPRQPRKRRSPFYRVGKKKAVPTRVGTLESLHRSRGRYGVLQLQEHFRGLRWMPRGVLFQGARVPRSVWSATPSVAFVSPPLPSRK